MDRKEFCEQLDPIDWSRGFFLQIAGENAESAVYSEESIRQSADVGRFAAMLVFAAAGIRLYDLRRVRNTEDAETEARSPI